MKFRKRAKKNKDNKKRRGRRNYWLHFLTFNRNQTILKKSSKKILKC